MRERPEELPFPGVSPEQGVHTNSPRTHVATEQKRQKEGEAPPHPGLEAFCGEEGGREGPV